MEHKPHAAAMIREFWNGVTGPRRLVAGLVALAVLGGLVALSLLNATTNYVPLSLGKQFSEDELQNVEALLRSRELHDFRREERRILVPADRVTQYDSALLEAGELPRNWAADWEEKFRETNPFSSAHELKMLREIALAKELRRIILGLDGVHDASVVWADSDARSWSARRRRVTATVNVWPRESETLPAKTIRAIQFSVANMVPDLQPQDVVVFDLGAGRHYQLSEREARFETEFDLWLERELSGWQSQLEERIRRRWDNARIVLTADDRALRTLGWETFSESPANDSSFEVDFARVRSQLTAELPASLQLRVELPLSSAGAEAERVDQRREWNDAPGRELLHALHAGIYADLSAPIAPESLYVTIAADPVNDNVADAARIVESRQALDPTVLVAALGCCLLLFAAAGRTMSRRRTEPPLVEHEPAHESPHTVATVESSPLGDPETVAAVLRQWLSRPGDPEDRDV